MMHTHTRKRSFVRRDSRVTLGQQNAYNTLWAHYGLDPLVVNSRNNPRYLEIGFGSGQSLLALAKLRPEDEFIGIETYKPGVGALLRNIHLAEIKNLKLYHYDAVEVLEKAIPPESLDGVHIFFPDPWQKRRHNDRRLIQPEFIKMLMTRIKPEGTLHLATDWEDYAEQMMSVLSAETGLENLAGENQFAARSEFRPIITKFEGRAIREGRSIWDLQFKRIS